MKITSWNVNGIRAAIGKGLAAWSQVVEPDVLCLQEVKARPEQAAGADQILPGSLIFWNPAQQPGYSGVATFTRKEPLEVENGLGEERFDREGRVLRMRFPDFLLYNIYFPNGQRGHDRVSYKLDFYARLLDECDRLHARGEKIILTGDFNTAHNDIDLAHPRENSTTSGFLPEERVWIDTYLQHGFVDIFRSLYPDRVQYTWWTYITKARARNVGWRIDYFLVSTNLVPRVEDAIIHDDVLGSDHCPITLIIKE